MDENGTWGAELVELLGVECVAAELLFSPITGGASSFLSGSTSSCSPAGTPALSLSVCLRE